jgi:hypothetical protein
MRDPGCCEKMLLRCSDANIIELTAYDASVSEPSGPVEMPLFER